MVGGEIFVGQVGVIVTIQPCHGDFGRVIAEKQLTNSQSVATSLAHAVILHVLACVDVVPEPFTIHPSGCAGCIQGAPSDSINGILKDHVEVARSAGQHANRADVVGVSVTVVDANVAVDGALLANRVHITIKSIDGKAR